MVGYYMDKGKQYYQYSTGSLPMPVGPGFVAPSFVPDIGDAAAYYAGVLVSTVKAESITMAMFSPGEAFQPEGSGEWTLPEQGFDLSEADPSPDPMLVEPEPLALMALLRTGLTALDQYFLATEGYMLAGGSMEQWNWAVAGVGAAYGLALAIGEGEQAAVYYRGELLSVLSMDAAIEFRMTARRSVRERMRLRVGGHKGI